MRIRVLVLSLIVAGLCAHAQDLFLDDDGGDGLGDLLEGLDGNRLGGLRGEERKKAVRDILSRRSPDDFRELVSIIEGDDDELSDQETVADILVAQGGDRLVPPGERLVGHVVPYKQAFGARLLGASGSQTAVPALLKAAGRARDEGAVRFQITAALGLLGDPRAADRLAAWGVDPKETDVMGRVIRTPLRVRLARLGVCLVGDPAGLAVVLEDADRVLADKALAAHNLSVMWEHWSPGARIARVREYRLLEAYTDSFAVLFRRMGADDFAGLAAFLQNRPDSGVADLVPGQLEAIFTLERIDALYPLLDCGNLGLETAVARHVCRISPEDGAGRVLTMMRARLEDADWEQRAWVMRMIDLFPPAERENVFGLGLGDDRAFVVEEALRSLEAFPVPELLATAAAVTGSEKWRDEPRIQAQVRRMGIDVGSGE